MQYSLFCIKEKTSIFYKCSSFFTKMKLRLIVFSIFSLVLLDTFKSNAIAQTLSNNCYYSVCDIATKKLIAKNINDGFRKVLNLKAKFLGVLETTKRDLLQRCIRQAVIILTPETLAKLSGMTLSLEYINNNAAADSFTRTFNEEIKIALYSIESTKETYRELQRLCDPEPSAAAIFSEAISTIEDTRLLIRLTSDLMK